LFNHEEIRQALRSSILSDFDRYLFDYSGRAQFVRDVDILVSAPIQGFELNSLLLETGKRREVWQKIQETIPSLDSILLLKPNEIANSSLNEGQKQTISKIVGDGKSLENIARDLSKDNLDAAKMFFQLIQSGLIEIQKGDGTDSYLQVQPEIFIVDDSPLIVQQFRSLVTNWGYKVNFSNNALTAVEAMINSKPSAIFLDINMPGASGFDLIKQIRRQTKLASLPVVLLTAEKTVANQWRAQWANCRFLSKPRTSEEVPTFKNELQNMLQEMIPLKS
jgi:CheY-like chemotaxis protein